jgi:hypothetical protein
VVDVSEVAYLAVLHAKRTRKKQNKTIKTEKKVLNGEEEGGERERQRDAVNTTAATKSTWRLFTTI